MRFIAFSIIAALFTLAPAAAGAAHTFSCSSPYVIDGDTMQCGDVRVRLAGIDAPELHGCKAGRTCTKGNATAARNALIGLTRTDVDCTALEVDRYGRTVALCAAAGLDLSCAMIDSGHAVARYRPLDCAGG